MCSHFVVVVAIFMLLNYNVIQNDDNGVFFLSTSVVFFAVAIFTGIIYVYIFVFALRLLHCAMFCCFAQRLFHYTTYSPVNSSTFLA